MALVNSATVGKRAGREALGAMATGSEPLNQEGQFLRKVPELCQFFELALDRLRRYANPISRRHMRRM